MDHHDTSIYRVALTARAERETPPEFCSKAMTAGNCETSM